MTYKHITMDALKSKAVRVYSGMEVLWGSEVKKLKLQEGLSEFNDCYAMNNSTVSFVYEGAMFVAPYTRELMQSIQIAGFQKAYFYVPFSNGDKPLKELWSWSALQDKAYQLRREEFLEKCSEYCNSKKIGTLKEETLKKCFLIPDEGVEVKHLYFEERYYPIPVTTENLGRYCTNNGIVVFVYRNGCTYVAKNYEIVNELRAAGYIKSELFVPFSNGEEIQGKFYRKQWEAIESK